MYPMNYAEMLDKLRADRDALDVAIVAMERLASGGKPRRGRPPKFATTEPRRRRFSAATRKRMSAAQLKRWEEQRQTAE